MLRWSTSLTDIYLDNGWYSAVDISFIEAVERQLEVPEQLYGPFRLNLITSHMPVLTQSKRSYRIIRFHRLVAKGLLMPLSYPWSQENPLTMALNETEVGENDEKRRFSTNKLLCLKNNRRYAYTRCLKKSVTWFLIITLANVNRFSKFFHQ